MSFLKIIAPFVNVLFFCGQLPIVINSKTNKIICTFPLILYTIVMYTCVITLCLGSHLLADHSGMKYYSTTMFTAQMMGYLFVAASYTTTTIVSIKNLQNHVRFLRQFTNLIGKVSMLDGIEINVPLNRSKIIGLLLTVHVLFNIFIHLFWFPIWDVLIVLMIKSYTFELLTAMIMHS